MKKTILIFLVIITGTFFGSCIKDTTGNVSKVTNFPIITLNGDDEVFVQQGDTYNDLGAVSMEGETQITTVTTYSNGYYWGSTGVDTSSPDEYVVTYSATNVDGFDGTALRTVWVANTGDFVTSIEGLYLANVQRGPSFAVSSQYTDMKYVIVKKVGNDQYEITDALGGYYDLGRAYGPDYAARGATITVNDYSTSDVTTTTGTMPGWGYVVTISNFTIIPGSTNSLTFTGSSTFANSTFKVQLYQVQF